MAEGDLCELADVQAWLPTQTGAAAEPILERLITAASKLICNYTSRSDFTVQPYVDLYDGSGREFILLRQWPVTEVASITLGLNSQITITDPTTFVLEQPIPSGSNQRLTLLGCQVFPRGRSNVSISYSAGYESIPFDVAQACIEIVGEAYQRRTRIGQSSVTMKDQSTVSFSQADMNASVRTMLAPYRRLVPC